MKKILALLLTLFAASASAQSTVVGGGGGVSSGSSVSGCSAYSLVYIDSAGNLACALAPVNGNVSTAGRGIFSVLDTITGASATSNFLNITGTAPGTLSATFNGAYLSFAGDNDNQLQVGMHLSGPAGTNGSNSSRSLHVTNENGAISHTGVYLEAGTATTHTGLFSVGPNTPTTAHGVFARGARDSSTFTSGGQFFSGTGTARIGVLASLASVNGPQTGLTSAGLLVNNSTFAGDIARFEDNGTAVFTIGDGGAITGTSSYTFSGASTGITLANQGFVKFNGNNDGQLVWYQANTPDQTFFALGTTSYSLGIRAFGSISSDLNNGPCGTAACTDPTLIISPVTGTTNEYNALAAWGNAGGSIKTLTESAATSVVRIPIANLAGAFGKFCYTVKAADATDSQIRGSCIKYTVTAKSGTETCSLNTEAALTSDPSIDQTEDGSGSGAITTGTLTYAITCDTTPSNAVDIQINAVSSLTQTTLNVTYFVAPHVGPGQPARQ